MSYKEKFHKNSPLLRFIYEEFWQKQRWCRHRGENKLSLFIILQNSYFQTDMMTKAELAFTALDRDNKGYISEKDFRKLTKKLSDQELKDLMAKV